MWNEGRYPKQGMVARACFLVVNYKLIIRPLLHSEIGLALGLGHDEWSNMCIGNARASRPLIALK